MSLRFQAGVLLFICLCTGLTSADFQEIVYRSAVFNTDANIGILSWQDEALSVVQHNAVLLQTSMSKELHQTQLVPISSATLDKKTVTVSSLLQLNQSLNLTATGKSSDQNNTVTDIIANTVTDILEQHCHYSQVVLCVVAVLLVLVLGHMYAPEFGAQKPTSDMNLPFKPHRRSSVISGFTHDAFDLACHKAFEGCDKDGSGNIDEKEIYAAVLKFYVHAAKKVQGLKAPSKEIVLKLAKVHARLDKQDSDATTMNYPEFKAMIAVLTEQLVLYTSIQAFFVYGVTPFIAIYVALFIDKDILPIVVKYLPFLSSRMEMVTPWCNNMITCLILTHIVPRLMSFADRQLLRKHNIAEDEDDD